MADRVELTVPDIGDFDSVEIIDVLVADGDVVKVEDGLITLETEKAAMDVPSTHAGRITELKVKTGDKVSKGDVIAVLEPSEESRREGAAPTETDSEGAAPTETDSEGAAPTEMDSEGAAPTESGDSEDTEDPDRRSGAFAPRTDTPDRDADVECEVLVLGAGPGGYTAAFRAADLGRKVVLVERYPTLGGVCLNVGCIPSKALLHVARVVEEAKFLDGHGVKFGVPKIDRKKLAAYKDGVVGKLTQGLAGLAKQRKVEVVTGFGRFLDERHVEVEGGDGKRVVRFEQAIIATGSSAVMLPDLPDDPRVMDSTDALELDDIPERMLVVGGGIIGLEMATVYAGLGTRVSVVELTDDLMPGCDRDLVKVLQKRLAKQCEHIWTATKVTGMKAQKNGIKVSMEGKDAPASGIYDRVLVAIGRRPNGKAIDTDKAGVKADERGFIEAGRQLRTSQEHIFAIGDVIGEPMLAHKASHEGKVAAEAASGMKSHFDAQVIPSVAYTDPEVAWCGLTETQAKAEGIEYDKGTFPWSASGRALALDAGDGFSKLLFDKQSGRVIGAGIVGPSAGDLIAETALAIEMGSDAADIGLTVHPHPTLSETVAFAAEAFEGTLTDLYIPKKK